MKRTLFGLFGLLIALGANAESSRSVDDNQAIPAAARERIAEKLRAKANPENRLRYDQPDKAELFALKKRLPQGEQTISYARYLDAQAHAEGMPIANGAARELVSAGRAPDAVSWTERGPGNIGGRTRAIAFDPVDADIMYIGGVAGGVFKSTDAGNNWAPIGDLMGNLAVTQIVVDRTNGNRIWAGTGEGMFNVDAQRGAGIFLSTDGGVSWNQLAATNVTAFQRVNDLIQSPNDASTLYAATRGGVYVSTDSGTSWSAFVETQGHVGGCFDLAARPGSGPADTVIAACGSFFSSSFSKPTAAVYRNTNARGGGTFSAVIPAAAGQARASIAYAPSDNNYAYAVFACSSSGAVGCGSFEDGVYKVFRSTDGGATWTTRFTNSFSTNFNPPSYPWGNLIFSNPVAALNGSIYGQGWYDNTLAVNPSNRDQIFAGGIDLFRSDDGGSTWGGLSYWWLDPTSFESYYVHADHHVYVFRPGYNGTTETRFYVGSDGGIQQASDAHSAARAQSKDAFDPTLVSDLRSATWNNQNTSLGITQFYHGDVYPNGTTYFGGTQDNGTNRGSDGAGANGWVEILGGDGGYVAVNPGNTNQLFAENFGLSIQRSDDGGTNWASKVSGITESGNNFQFINPFTIDPNTATRLWTGGARMWRTVDSGDTWTAASTVIATTCSGFPEFFSAHAVAPGNSNLVLAGGDCGYIHRNAAATTATGTTVWANVLPRPGYVSSFAFDPTNTLIAYATYATFGGSHVWRTADGGATWAAIDGVGVNALPDIPAHSVLVDPRSSNTIWVGTDLGVFVTLDGGANWARENTGFANVFTEHLDLHQVNPTTWKLFAFTHGRGVFMTTLTSGTNPSTTVLSALPDPNSTFGQNVAMTATVSGGSGTATGNVTFLDGATVLGTVTLSSGTAVFNTTALSIGTHNLSANYSGDGTYLASSGVDTHEVITPPNTPPTITGPGNQTIDEDTNSGALTVTVGDAETATTSLALTGSSGNLTLVPDGNIVFGGSDANRTVTITPAANQSGVATITLRVTDGGGLFTETSFTLTVNAVNDPPTISGPSTQTINEDGNTGALAVTVGDVETAAASLSLTATSNNTTLVPNNPANIVLGGSGANRTVTIVPALDQSGVATITLRVTDGGSLFTETSFTVTVNAVNDPPTIVGPSNQTIAEDTNSGTLAVTVGDVETAAASLSLTATSNNTTLVPNNPANIVLGGSGANRTVTIVPALDQSGVATITLRVTDGGGLFTETSFTVTVSAVNDAPSYTAGSDVSVVEDSGAYSAAWATAISAGPANESGQTVSFAVANDNNGLFSVQPAISTAGTLTFTPAAGQSGSALVTVNACDDGTPAIACAVQQQFTITVTPADFVDFALTKSNGLDQLIEGQTTVYTIAVTNNGNVSGTAFVADNLVPGLASMTWTCTGTGCAATSGSGSIAENITLAAGASITYSVTAVVNGAAGDTVENFASVEALTPSESGTNADNSATDSDPIVSDDLFDDGFETVAP